MNKVDLIALAFLKLFFLDDVPPDHVLLPFVEAGVRFFEDGLSALSFSVSPDFSLVFLREFIIANYAFRKFHDSEESVTYGCA